MLKKMNFRSKKGLSLAVALTICLFMVLVTGGITTVAMLQHKETGSNMNTRQAYISAKSGLDTMQDALENDIVTSLPAGIGDEYAKYCILYYDGATGELKSVPITMPANGDITSVVSQKIEDLLRDGHEIVGGEGTYFKITNQDGKKYNVTALNTTGKYNDDLTLNRGDLSFDIIMTKTYTVTIDPTPAPTAPPTGPTTINPPPGGLANRFMLVGQQTCLNEATMPGNGNTSTGRTLNQDYVEKEPGSGAIVFDGVCYLPYNENSNTAYNYTYFPVVYDKMVKLTSNADRVSIDVIDEGIYIVGSAYGDIVDQFVDDNGRSFGNVSYFTQNAEYSQNFNCNFLCIKENFVVKRQSGWDANSGKDPVVNYCGTQGLDYVVVNIPEHPVTFFTVTDGKKIVEDFTVPVGYYKLDTGSHLNDESAWKDSSGNWKTLTPAEQTEWEKVNIYPTIKSYVENGEIRTGSNETAYGDTSSPKANVQIVDNNGRYKTGGTSETSGYSSDSSWVPDYASRANHSVFFSPNYPITTPGYYHWHCGNTFNFQWFRNASTPLTVANGANVKMSASTIVLTIGPDVKAENGSTVTVSKEIKGEAGASWELCGANGTGTTALYVMSDFNVTYAGGSYPVQAGYYINVPSEGVNLFSLAGENYFRYTSDVRSLNNVNEYVKYPVNVPEDPTSATTTDNTTTTDAALTSVSTNSAVMPANVSANTLRTLSIFNRTKNVMALSPMTTLTTVDDDADHAVTIKGAETLGHTEVVADYELEHLYFEDDDLTDGFHDIPVNSTLKIQRKLSPTQTTDYIIFNGDAGRSFRIPVSPSDGSSLDLYEPDIIDARQGEAGANYSCTVSPEEVKIIKKYY